jgi:hypothetical protein
MARAWSFKDEPEVLERHLPETYELLEVPREALHGERARWVLKRSLGRVGDQVCVGALCPDDDWRRAVDWVLERAREGESWIVQRFVPQRPITTPWGDRLVTLGAYVLDGRFAGYFARVTPDSHVSHEALCVPVFARRAA